MAQSFPNISQFRATNLKYNAFLHELTARSHSHASQFHSPGLNTGLFQCFLTVRFHMYVVFVCFPYSAMWGLQLGFFQQRLVLGLAGTGTTDFKNLGENMQGCRKTQTSQTSITDDVCCPPTLPIPESHSASQPPVQPLLWRSEWETGPKGSVNPHYHHYPLACLVI